MHVVEVRVASGAPSEIVGAEAWAAGASGIEERSEERGWELLIIYAPAGSIDAVREAVSAVDFPGTEVGASRVAEERDWVEEWRHGLEAVEVGPRLVVRPSFVESQKRQGQFELVIDPGQAFGTGGHASTRLALETIEQVASEPTAFTEKTRVLDVGAGTGVLALAALGLGAGRAVGFDLDPESGRAARIAALENELGARFDMFVGGIEVLGDAQFDWVFANLLKREMLPIASEIAAATRPGGHAIFSGLLGAERDEVERALGAVGFSQAGVRTHADANGDVWIALLMSRS